MSDSELNDTRYIAEERSAHREEHDSDQIASIRKDGGDDTVAAEGLLSEKTGEITAIRPSTGEHEGNSESQASTDADGAAEPTNNDLSTTVEQIDLEAGSTSSETPNIPHGNDNEETKSMRSQDHSSSMILYEDNIHIADTEDNEDAKQANGDNTEEVMTASKEDNGESKENDSTRPMLNDDEYEQHHDRGGSDVTSIHSNDRQSHDSKREMTVAAINNDNRGTDIGVEANNDGSIIDKSSIAEDNHQQTSDSVESVRGSLHDKRAKEDQWSNRGATDNSTVSGFCDSHYSASIASEERSLESVSDIDGNSDSTFTSMTPRQTKPTPDTLRKGSKNKSKQKKQHDSSSMKSSDASTSTEVTKHDKNNNAVRRENDSNDSSNGQTREMTADKAGSTEVRVDQNENGYDDTEQASTTKTSKSCDQTAAVEDRTKDENTQHGTNKPDSQPKSNESDTISARDDYQPNSTDTEEPSKSDETAEDSERKSTTENITEENNSNSQRESKRSRTKAKSVRSIIKKELKQQLSTYINEDRRLLAFDPKGEKATSTIRNETGKRKRKATLKKNAELKLKIDPSTPVSANELNRLVRTAGKMLNEAELEEIWSFHQFRVGKKLDRSPRNGYVQNYSRHFGSILRSSQYQQFYGGLYSKPNPCWKTNN